MEKEQFIDLLGRKCAIEVIIGVKANPGCSKNDIIQREKASSRTRTVRIEELIACGIIDPDDKARQHGTIKLYLSPAGQEIASHLERTIELADSLPPLPEEGEIIIKTKKKNT
ncbi:MAG: hypothetical protein E7Z62_08040 [Thermoplasmata archaeon]|nr:hypothetical protein [Thermoplasmata archaeon]